ncbi:hypothetical protein AHiyo8_24980 [Arthrobacter sp. Hiyo8]|nr:hypothetical protein AHiyo8_24980 [Arthrobacter sp. Hiyo8]
MCGIEPCAPFPYTVILSESAAERTGPGVVATVPAGIGITCCAKATSGRGTLATSPSSSIAWDPAPISSPGWNSAIYVPDQAVRPSAMSLAAPSSAATCRSCPHACMTPSTADA